MLSFAIVLCLGALASSAPPKVFYSLEKADNHFEDFMKTYNKEYKSEAEKLARFEIFKNNLVDINEMNVMNENTVFGVNHFSDFTQEEFTRMNTGFLPAFGGETACRQMRLNESLLTAQDSFDWRDQQKVTSVKNQGQCGSCWAFSTVGTIEGQYAMKHNQLIDLAPQQLVDCLRSTKGCNGGWMSSAILELAQQGGVMSEQTYPYTASVSTCKANPSHFAVKVTGCRQFQIQREEELKDVVTRVGPISIAIAASMWQHYNGGILDMCDRTVNHAVLLVGYGTEGGRPYWLIKNSWGTQWGENGYIKMSMNKNTCNLLGGQFVTAVVQ